MVSVRFACMGLTLLQASRPVVTVFSSQNGDKASTAVLPAVFRAPIRTDVVTFVHDNMHKNQ
jgi:large subunit ribosomal protein L4e